MEYKALIDNITAYILLLIFVMSLALIIVTILRWLNPKFDKEKRRKRLNILGIIAFIVFLIMLAAFIVPDLNFSINPDELDQADKDQVTITLIYLSKIVVKAFLTGTVVIFALFLTLAISLFAFYGFWILCHTGLYLFSRKDKGNAFENDLKRKNERLKNVLKNPILIAIFTGGIIAVFCIIPIIVSPASAGLTDGWTSGVIQVINKIEGNDYPFYKALSLYILIYISVLGIGFSILNIIYEIIQNLLTKDSDKGFWSEYSNSIGLIAVGVSILLMITSKKFKLPDDGNWAKLFGIALSSFFAVIVVIALGILSLEIVRLLLNMKETLIREQSRYIFFLLIGQCTIVIILTLTMIYNALRSFLSGNIIRDNENKDSMEDISGMLIDCVSKDIRRKILNRSNYKEKHNKESAYYPFEKTTVKADEENINEPK